MGDYVTRKSTNSRLPPEVNRILYVRNLPFTISADEMYMIFGKYGAIYQIRLGQKEKDTRGTAFVIYEDIYDAKSAVDHLSGFNVGGRYLIVLYYQPSKFNTPSSTTTTSSTSSSTTKNTNPSKRSLSSSSEEK